MRKILLLVCFLGCILEVYAQKMTHKQIIEQRIAHRASILEKVSKKELTDSLKKQISDYHQLTEILANETRNTLLENQKLKNELNKYLIITSSDTLIFHQDFNAIRESIPTCLEERSNIVNSIIELRTKIIAAENVTHELEEKLGNTPIAYAAIREKIEKDLDQILSLIRDIKKMNLSSLSEEQQKYFRPGLTERYNNFKKYFTK
ncbi:hypothetical protein [Porphyromonas gulae]|uniref:Uncharacterized protein n=1 Tax=Porphyromonas gulae TaxID=111105 RepID=A0A0A2F6R8_9PORP|nr:hypothetical protein [Porphyromonas gulae]KGN86693.1 hypothetical protein HR08_03400 [Porphyromonas gulae]